MALGPPVSHPRKGRRSPGIMPSAAARRIYEDQIPSFMSVFDLDAETMTDQDTVTVVDPKLVGMEQKPPVFANPTTQSELRQGAIATEPSHKHNDSGSTQMSESADSSPTTTLSTTDSSPLSDPSPSSSPDSPVNLIPLKNYPSTSFGMQLSEQPGLIPAPAGKLERPMTSPSPRRPRNMKGLSIQPPSEVSSTTALVSEPASPSFIKPKIPGMRRKPSQLSLKTSSTDLLHRTTLEVPPSPAMPPILQRRALKHSTSSPHMLTSLKTSTFGPVGGMTFPKVLERNESGLSEVLRPMKSSMNATFSNTIMEEETPIKPQMANRTDFEPYHESVNNEDQKSPGYPDGPIAIYEDNVFLYLEPTAEEAARFDTVINVAQEVKNPFDSWQERRMDLPIQARIPQSITPADESPIPDTAVTTASYATAFEYLPSEASSESPTTPKAGPPSIPEYIHMPWEHNTDITPDLLHLCQKIEERTKAGKKVLIHCQQGASRSASLIIAYGLYQKPELTVNDAYYAAQAKSRWISPNMKLMYSLQDFHKELSQRRNSTSSAYRPRASRSPTKHRLTLSADAIETSTKEPRSAPLPGERQTSTDDRDGTHSPKRARGNSSPGPQPASAGPSSAPSSYPWTEAQPMKAPSAPSAPSYPPPPVPVRFDDLPQRPKAKPAPPELHQRKPSLWDSIPPTPGLPAGLGSHATFGFQSLGMSSFRGQPKAFEAEDKPVERFLAITPEYPSDDALLSPRVETMTNNPLHESTEVAGMRFTEEAPMSPTEGLFSPRETMFPRNPFHPFGRPSQFSDPRSPPTKGETPIVRSIDDVL